MSFFNKKPRETYNDDDFNNDFYRGPEDEDGMISDEDDDDLVPPMPAAAPKKNTPAGAGSWKVLKPHNAQDGLIIADYLMTGCTVVMNLEELDRDVTVRLIDFLMGAVHVLDGELRQVSKSTFVISPRKGEITEDGQIAREAEGGSFR